MKLVLNPVSLLRHRIGKKVLALVIAIQILNLSIDAVDPSPYSEDLTINEIESCVEFILEIVMGHEDAIEETDDSDHHTQKPGGGVTLFSGNNSTLSIESSYRWISIHNHHFKDPKILSINRTIVLPPPKDSKNC